MPRTTFGPGPSYPKDEQGLRKAAERQHRRQQEWTVLMPLWISVNADGGSAEEHSIGMVWKWQHHYFMDKTYEKPRNELLAEDYRRFCYKDCALYGVGERGTSQLLRRQAFDRIYRLWFPSRADDVDISHGSFFCHWINIGDNVPTTLPTIAEVLAFHADLCSRVKQAVPEMGLPTPFTASPLPATEEHSLLSPRAAYALRPSFERCFIYLHAEQGDHSLDSSVMRDRGVRVVFVREAYATEHGISADEKPGVTRRREEEHGLERAAVFRCDTIETAMRLVLGKDPRRSEKRQERHGYYENEVLDTSPDTTCPAQPCLCSRCVEKEKRRAV